MVFIVFERTVKVVVLIEKGGRGPRLPRSGQFFSGLPPPPALWAVFYGLPSPTRVKKTVITLSESLIRAYKDQDRP